MNKFNFLCICCGLSITLLGVACAAEPSPQLNKEMIPMNEQSERLPPEPVTPVEINNVRYQIVHNAKFRGFGQSGGVIAAVDIATGKELWTLTVYQTKYDASEERDVQDVYITKLIPSQDKSMLQVENEAQKSYLVNLSTHEIVEITKK
jgi:hypothetical protein